MTQREVSMVGCGRKGASTNRDDAPGVPRVTRRRRRACAPGPARGALRLGPARAFARGGKRTPRIVESAIAESGYIFMGSAGNLG